MSQGDLVTVAVQGEASGRAAPTIGPEIKKNSLITIV